jgi:FkbH-like protein
MRFNQTVFFAMKRFFVACSSYLNSRHRAWEKFRELYTLEFSEYGDIHSVWSDYNNDSCVVSIVFLDDLLDDQTSAELQTSLSDCCEYLIDNVTRRCQKSGELFIFAYSFSDAFDPIRSAKRRSKKLREKIKLAEALETLCSRYAFLYVLDIDACFEPIGTERAFDSRNWYFARSRLSNFGMEQLVSSIRKIATRYQDPPHKVLVLDCDNTLWGGVVGEEGITGIQLGTDGLGKAFFDFQKAIRCLKDEGVLLALSSKNNIEDVWEVFDKHDSMLLKRKDLVAAKVDWNEKSKNILALSKELDLNVNSFVFWDDSPVEREKASFAIPEMLTVEVPSEVHHWPTLLKTLFEFARFYVTEEDRQKTAQYEARYKFIESKNNATDEDSFLKSIALRGEFIKLNQGNIARAVQLCQKTNQFNLTTKRYTSEQLLAFAANDTDFCVLARLTDRFADYGLVGLVCLREIDRQTLLLENLLLSCRVLGRKFEFWIMDKILALAACRGYKQICAVFVDSGKNLVSKDYLPNCGFLPNGVEMDSSIGLAKNGKNVKVFMRNLEPLKCFDRRIYEGRY